jgi:mycothiol synthase
MALSIERRALGPADGEALGHAINEALEAGDMEASSDPEAAYIMKTFAADPGQFGGAFDGDDLIGFVVPDFKVIVVRPDQRRRGIGRQLVEAGLAMAREKRLPGLLMGVMPGDSAGRAFLEATGFSFHSIVWNLDLSPNRAVLAPTWPDGLVARPFDRGRDLDPWLRLFNAAFADHATPLQLDQRIVDGLLADPDIDDADTIVVEELATSELVGFCGTDPQRRDGALGTHAELWSIGVRPDRQGRGLGRQLVRAGVERVRSIGIHGVGLSVNARNAGAVNLYESEGFVRTTTRERWSRLVDAVGGTDD